MAGIELVRLVCKKCHAPMKGDPRSVFVYCASCNTGYELDSEEQLHEIAVYFGILPGVSSRAWRPFWTFDAKLEMADRESKRSLSSFFSGGEGKGLAGAFSQRGGLRFYVPAYEDPKYEDESIGMNLTRDQPDFQFVKPEANFPIVAIGSEDAMKLADFIFISSEIEQPDMLRDLDYSLLLENPMLMALCFE